MAVRLLPRRWLGPLAKVLARALKAGGKRRKLQAENNLRLVYGDGLSDRDLKVMLDRIAEHAALTLLECLWVGKSADRLRGLMDIQGIEHVHEARKLGRGVILWTGHFGNWELAGCRLSVEGLPVFAFIRQRASRLADATIAKFRRGFGIEPIPLDAGIRTLARLLKQNFVFGHVADSPAPADKGQRVQLLGHECHLWPTAIVLSLLTGAPVLPVFSWRQPDGRHILHIHGPITIERSGAARDEIEINFAKLIPYLEDAIRSHPEQWAWYHERWHSDRQPENRR
ncbi:MAG: hypothetical protein N2512_10685 [Armatimonadetes bacterium]|nr:hypothetical protein [Armatimonadota bacterium]